jgi:hypothetical protein
MLHGWIKMSLGDSSQHQQAFAATQTPQGSCYSHPDQGSHWVKHNCLADQGFQSELNHVATHRSDGFLTVVII